MLSCPSVRITGQGTGRRSNVCMTPQTYSELPMLQVRELRGSKGGVHSPGAHRDMRERTPGQRAEREKGRQAWQERELGESHRTFPEGFQWEGEERRARALSLTLSSCPLHVTPNS